jgi:hypothetical protein
MISPSDVDRHRSHGRDARRKNRAIVPLNIQAFREQRLCLLPLY